MGVFLHHRGEAGVRFVEKPWGHEKRVWMDDVNDAWLVYFRSVGDGEMQSGACSEALLAMVRLGIGNVEVHVELS